MISFFELDELLNELEKWISSPEKSCNWIRLKLQQFQFDDTDGIMFDIMFDPSTVLESVSVRLKHLWIFLVHFGIIFSYLQKSV